jgi:hypothetical protein
MRDAERERCAAAGAPLARGPARAGRARAPRPIREARTPTPPAARFGASRPHGVAGSRAPGELSCAGAPPSPAAAQSPAAAKADAARGGGDDAAHAAHDAANEHLLPRVFVAWEQPPGSVPRAVQIQR